MQPGPFSMRLISAHFGAEKDALGLGLPLTSGRHAQLESWRIESACGVLPSCSQLKCPPGGSERASHTKSRSRLVRTCVRNRSFRPRKERSHRHESPKWILCCCAPRCPHAHWWAEMPGDHNSRRTLDGDHGNGLEAESPGVAH